MAEILRPGDGAAQMAADLANIGRRLAGLETARNVPAVLAQLASQTTVGFGGDRLTTLSFQIPPGGYDAFFVAFAWELGDGTLTEAWLECLGEQSSRFRLVASTGTMSFAWCRPGGEPWPSGPLTLDDDGHIAQMRLWVADTAATAGNETDISQVHAVWLRCDSHPTLEADESGHPTLDPFVL